MEPLIDNETLFALFEGRKPPEGVKSSSDRVLSSFQNAAPDQKRASIYIYDQISFWTGNDARTFKSKLDAIQADVIDLHINSPGGGVFEGVTIYNLLVAHKAKIIVHIDGLAASIASVIALAGDEVLIAENAMMMIHDPSTIIWGKAEDMRKAADVLDSIKAAILNTYVTRTGMDRDELARAMANETWYSADEAVSNKFANRKVTPIKAAAFWNGEEFPGIPENVRKLFSAQAEEPPAEKNQEEDEPPAPDVPENKGTVEDVTGALDLVSNLRKLHGL